MCQRQSEHSHLSAAVHQASEISQSKALHDEVDKDPRLSGQHPFAWVVKRERTRIAVPAREEANEFAGLDGAECEWHRQERDTEAQSCRLRDCLRITEDESRLAVNRLLGCTP